MRDREIEIERERGEGERERGEGERERERENMRFLHAIQAHAIVCLQIEGFCVVLGLSTTPGLMGIYFIQSGGRWFACAVMRTSLKSISIKR